MSSQEFEKKVRLVHNIPGAPAVDIYVGKKMFVENLSYGNVTAYLNLDKDKVKISINVTGTSTVLLRQKLRLTSEYTSLIIAGSGTVRLVSLSDRMRTPNYGYSHIRFIQDYAGVDLYINGVLFDKSVKSEYHKYKLTGDGFAFVEIRSGESILVSTAVAIASRSILSFILSGIQDGTDYPLKLIIGYDNGLNVYTLDKLKQDFAPQQYMGKWYQIADIPQFYEAGCDRATAQYTLLQTKVNVFNSCFDKGWNLLETINGSAVITDPQYPSVLTVSFPFAPENKVPFILPGPNYLVHYTDYESYALVGSPFRSSLYVLSRTPKMQAEFYERLAGKAKHLGYDISKLKLNFNSLK